MLCAPGLEGLGRLCYHPHGDHWMMVAELRCGRAFCAQEIDVAKIKLSETLRFLGTRLNKITGSDLEFLLEVEEAQVRPGEAIHAEARVRSPESGERELTHITISLRGQVQREGKWLDYDQRAEVAHNTHLPGGHEFVVPIEVLIPEDAVLSEDGATWSLRAQAVVDRSVDPRAEASFEVVGG
ncbi:hypothetical protein FRC98_00010 [Lujinxingia vulgaris]|uniref:Arrestin-like N-terminal domain-containing protein n=1 Tax=Lujinxingia vulgaris TaxID=2600176 RepID=A0A5C6XE77_9DELT|nr:hypothetical protein FRC98_00010 [Lujinxingia vulgaris]